MPNRTLRTRSKRGFLFNVRHLPLWRRIDPMLIVLLALGMLIIFGGWGIIEEVQRRSGAFDAHVLEPLVDERILTNVRDHLPTQAILDTMYDPADGRLYLSQAGGTFQLYDPATGLWQTDTPPLNDAPIDRNFVRLGADCGSYLTPLANCADPQTVWALSAQGGLIRHENGTWQTIFNTSAFHGADGQLVQQDQLTTAAVTGDWLVVGTRSNGIGLYNIPRRTWQDTRALNRQLPALAITQLQAWQGLIWVGTPAGLRYFSPADQQVRAVSGLADGAITALASDNTLWIMQQRDCATDGGNACLWLGKLTAPDQNPTTLIDERNHYADLSLSHLTFAQAVGDQLVLAGDAGIYGYDNRDHSWQRLSPAAVRAVLPLSSGDGFYFAHTGGVGLIKQASLVSDWQFSGDSIEKLLYSNHDGEILALTRNGRTGSVNLYAVSTANGDSRPVYQHGETALDPAHFTAAIGAPNTVLFISPKGVLLHRTDTRTYTDIDLNHIPDWLIASKLQVATQNTVFIFDQSHGQNVSVYPVAVSDIGSPDFYQKQAFDQVQPIHITGPVQQTWVWDASSIGVIAGDGSVLRLSSQGIRAQTGQPETNLLRTPPNDVLQLANSLIFASGRDLLQYDLQTRAWSTYQTPINASSSEQIAEITAAGSDVLAVTNAGRLITAGGVVKIGGTTPLSLNDQELSDALGDGANLYLAGSGTIDRYRTDQRQIDQVWKVNGSSVRLLGVINDQPLALSGTTAWFGSSSLLPGSGDVTSLSYDNHTIWTVRQTASGSSYLMGQPFNNLNSTSAAQCFFRQPTAGQNATTIRFARRAPDGTIIAASNDGVKFYSSQARSWFGAPPDLVKADEIYTVGDRIVFLKYLASGVQVQFVPVNSLRLPSSCSLDPVTLNIERDVSVRAAAVDETVGKVALVGLDGQVSEWGNGQITDLLAANNTAPQTSAFRHVFDRQQAGYLLVTTASQLWRYILTTRAWQPINLIGAPQRIAQIDVEPSGSGDRVTVTGTDGAVYAGTLLAANTNVRLVAVGNTPATSLFGRDGSAIQDVQPRGKQWAFVLDDQIRYFDPSARQWQSSNHFASSQWSFDQALGRGVVVDSGGSTWWVASSATDAPTNFNQYAVTPTSLQTFLTDNGAIWRRNQDGSLDQCTATQQTYQCAAQYHPFVIDPATVEQAVVWQKSVLFKTAAGLRAFDQTTGQERVLSGGAALTGKLDFIYRDGDVYLLMYSRAQKQIVMISRNLAFTTLDGVDNLIVADDGQLWAQQGTNWLFYNNGGWTPVQTAAHLFGSMNSPITGVDPAGLPYVWLNGKLQAGTLPLPEGFAIDNLLYDAGGWWVVRGGQVDYVAASQCPVAATPEPTAESTETATAQATEQATTEVTEAATPELTPCLSVTAQANTGLTHIAYAHVFTNGGHGLDLVGDDGTALRITLTAGGATVDPGSATLPSYPLADDWGNLQANMAALPDGRSAYAPVVQLTQSAPGQALSAHRADGVDLPLADHSLSADQFTLPPPLSAGWLSWDRAQQGFNVQTDTGSVFFHKQQFVIDQHLLFEPADAVLVADANSVYAANVYGLWRFSQPDLRLDDTGIVYYPATLTAPITAEHGVFLSGDQQYQVVNNQLVSAAISPIQFKLGDATFSEDPLNRTVNATVQVGGTPVNALVADGFLWDQDRRGIAYSSDSLLLQSAAGIHPVAPTFTGFDPGPDSSGQLVVVDGRTFVHSVRSNSWYEQIGAASWTPATDPTLDRALVQDAIWTWRLSGGALQVTLNGTAYNFAVTTQGGFGFSFDQLHAAASDNQQLYVASTAFLETAAAPADLGTLSAARQGPVQTGSLQVFPFADGSTRLYSLLNGAITVWNDQTRSFDPVSLADDPRQNRPLIATDRLRFTRTNGGIVKTVRLDNLSGGNAWAAYNFEAGRFPFDVVRSAAVFDQKLYVGSDAGLQIYDSAGKTDLASLAALLDFRAGSTGDLAPVKLVGTPQTDPSLLMARGDSVCLQLPKGGQVAACADAVRLDQRLRLTNAYWQWTRDANGTLLGQYRRADGQLDSAAIRYIDGRLPQDRITSASVCGGKAATLWDGRWVSDYDSDSLTLTQTVLNFDLSNLAPKHLFCIPTPIESAQRVVNPGLYLQTSSGQFYQFVNNNWTPISDSGVAGDITNYFVQNPVIFQAAHLRYRQAQIGTQQGFEYRLVNKDWLPLQWVQNPATQGYSLNIDVWEQIVNEKGQLWAATAAGFVPVQRTANGAALDTNTLAVVPLPTKDCIVTDLDGSFARCDNHAVYTGTLQNGATLTPADHDPFAEVNYVAGDWTIRLTGRQDGKAGALEAQLHGEPTQIVGGRWLHDAISSLALFSPDMVDLATDSDGWFTAPRAALPVSSLTRPSGSAVATVDELHIGKEDNEFLCLHVKGGDYLRMNPDRSLQSGSTQTCPVYQADDPLWRYTIEAGKLAISAPQRIGQVSSRLMKDGRFNDDQATGVPLPLRENDHLVYYVPTAAGIIVFDDHLLARRIYTEPFHDLDQSATPDMLYLASSGTNSAQIGYWGGDTFYTLTGQTPVGDLKFPNAVPLTRAQHNQDTIRLSWQDAQGSAWMTVNSITKEQVVYGYAVDVRNFSTYLENRGAWNDPVPLVTVHFTPNSLHTSFGGRERDYPLPANFQLVDAILLNDHVVIVGAHDLLALDLHALMRDLESR